MVRFYAHDEIDGVILVHPLETLVQLGRPRVEPAEVALVKHHDSLLIFRRIRRSRLLMLDQGVLFVNEDPLSWVIASMSYIVYSLSLPGVALKSAPRSQPSRTAAYSLGCPR